MLPRVRFLSPVARRLQLREACGGEVLRLLRAKAKRVHLREKAVRS